MKYSPKRIFSWISSKVIVKDCPPPAHTNVGRGAFATQDITKDEKIAMFGGYVMTREEEENLSYDINDNAIQIDDNLVIGAKAKNEIDDGSMFNHSCNANAGIRGQILLVAMRNILSGEQITFDYGTVLYHKKGIKPYRLKCSCGESLCRGIITDNDWKSKSLQKQYRGYFPLHIQDKIDKLK